MIIILIYLIKEIYYSIKNLKTYLYNDINELLIYKTISSTRFTND